MRWIWGVLAGVVVAIGATVGAQAVTQAQGRHNRELAVAAAIRLLGDAVLPADATPMTGTPSAAANQLTRPFGLYPYLASVDRSARFLTSAGPDAVVASVAAHLPPGARRTANASGGLAGQPDSESFSDWTLPAPGGWSPGRSHLGVEAITLGGGRTGVRVDADVRFSAPHPPGAMVPTSARTMTVTLTTLTGRTLLSRMVTGVRVRRLAALIDGLPLLAPLPGEAFSCPAFSGTIPTVTLTFRDAAGHTVAVVSEPAEASDIAGPCSAVPFTVRGHTEPALLDGRTLLRRVGAIVGLRLLRRG